MTFRNPGFRTGYPKRLFFDNDIPDMTVKLYILDGLFNPKREESLRKFRVNIHVIGRVEQRKKKEFVIETVGGWLSIFHEVQFH